MKTAETRTARIRENDILIQVKTMYRKDIDRHMDNMAELRKMEISAEDRNRLKTRDRFLIRMITVILILAAAAIIFRQLLLS